MSALSYLGIDFLVWAAWLSSLLYRSSFLGSFNVTL